MLKLLLIAPTCDGGDVGEAWVAYQWVRLLSARHDVTVLTYAKRGKPPLSRQLPGVRVVEWAEPPLLGRAERFNSMLKPGYLPFYYRARHWIRAALARGERFDLAHQPVPVALRYPSPVAGLGLPFVIGPAGGSLQSPPGFRAEEGTSPWYTGLRALDGWRLRHDPWLRRTYQQAGCVIGIAPYVSDLVAPVGVRSFEVMSETGIEQLPEPVDRSGRDGTVRLLYVGRLVRTKGARDAIRALGMVRDLPAHLAIVGDGPDRAVCERLVAGLGLTGRVSFHGWQPREVVTDFYRAADVFVFPSYREPGGNVPWEAMSHGLPLLVSDTGGPGAVVDGSCGMRVHPVTPQRYAAALAAELARLIEDPGLRARLGEGARQRVLDAGLWVAKAAPVEAIYAKVLAEHASGRGHESVTPPA